MVWFGFVFGLVWSGKGLLLLLSRRVDGGGFDRDMASLSGIGDGESLYRLF
jgi:hypothetical protein